MAYKKISQLTTITETDAETYIPIIKGDALSVDNYKISPDDILKKLPAHVLTDSDIAKLNTYPTLTGESDKFIRADGIISEITSDKHFEFEQGLSSKEWTIVHNLNKYPSVTVVDFAGTTVEGLVKYIDKSTIIIYFSAKFSGLSYLN